MRGVGLVLRTRRLCALAAICAAGLAARARAGDVARTLEEADALFEQKNYKDAAGLYEEAAKAEPRHAEWRHASERAITCKLRLQLFDPAIEAAEAYIVRCRQTPYEARAERLAGNLYMLVPKWGTRAGGRFHRAQHKQGIRVQSHQYDKRHAVEHLERARELYARYDRDAASLTALPKEERGNWHNERIECIFDLASALSRFGIYENQWHFWYSFWGERDEFLAETAGERDFDEYSSRWQRRRKRPTGLRLASDGEPLFPVAPAGYSKDLSDDEKMLFLLKEARDLDRTRDGKYAALSYYRQAMLARARFGMDRLNGYAAHHYWGGKCPLKEELEAFNPWELEDGEALLLAGGRVRRIGLPAQWDVLGLLRTVVGDYARSGLAAEAQYAVGLYHQSRQQYLTALGEYDVLKMSHPESPWAGNAGTQVSRIKRAQVRISQAGVQLAGGPAELQFSYRNTTKVWFVARRLDHAGFMDELRTEDLDPDKGSRGFWALRSWHNYFVHGRRNDRIWRLAARHVGKEVVRWAEEVADDGTHRYAQATTQTPLEGRGAYLVHAYLTEPPADHAEEAGEDALALGESRAVLVLADLAMVEKKVKDGNLYFICDARTGAPVPDAGVSVVEVWSVYDRKKRKSTHHRETHELVTDEEGMAVLKRPERRYGNLHVLVRAAGGRLAWSGMSYWRRYSPSRMRSGLFAYCITDRPVYRPEQTVRFKVWLRQMRDGILQNHPHRSVGVTIFDPRGNKVHTVSKRTDEYGGLDSEFTLGAEPRLGVWRIRVSGASYRGGQNFRVEEYKKPEFEVTVEPGRTHARLGEKLTAVVKATYYFGGPVKEATVKYKVFREEYTHRYYFPGEWDWLYGPGYGLVWYEYPWMPWWGRMRCSWVAPGWWWGFYGGSPPNPIRELAHQGETHIGGEGTVELEIDTSPALRDHPDRDHRYVVEAEVRDASRRVITGQGAVKATRQSYYAFVRPDRGYCRPGEEMVVRVRCLTPDNEPVETEGVVTVSSVVFGGPDNARIEETELRRWRASTDERGQIEFRLRHEKSGQLKIRFVSPDRWGGTVEGYGLVWVCGRDFDGKLYRFNDLELITDKRTYRPGEVAHVMINTNHPDSHVLYSDEVDSNCLLSWRLLRLPGKHTVVDLPIRREHGPNFFVEATTVAGARVHQQSKRICVPPEEGVVRLTVEADKPEYKPGEKATVKLSAVTRDGEPARAQVTLSAFDKSVLYIQPEYAPPIAKFFHGNLRQHRMQMTTNLLEQFSAWGYILRPFQQLHPHPQAWWGVWGPAVGDWRAVSDKEMLSMSVGGTGYLGDQARKDGLRRRSLAKAEAGAAGPADAMAAPRAPSSVYGLVAEEKAKEDSGRVAAGAAGLAEAEVRKAFADTAAWFTALTTDFLGKTTVSFEMPENLTTWKVNAWAMTADSRVGQDDTSVITTKNVIVRLQAPRFFMEYDEVVLSANVHSYLPEAKTARVSIELPEEFLKMIGETPAETEVSLPAFGERRVDWRVKVLKEGTATIKVEALTDVESDAMQMTFPVLVHGMTKQVASTGSMRPDDAEKTATVELLVPEKRRPEFTRLEVQYAPSLVGAMMDALPYCIYYPYGCTEQTMSRFVPCVLTLKTLRNMGVSLAEVRNIRGRLAEIRRMEKGERMSVYWMNPIFDEAELDVMIAQSLSRISNMQHGDGGWGWWTRDSSSGYLTSYVLYSLCTAEECGVELDRKMIDRGMQFLKRWEEGRMRERHWSPHARHAYVAYVLSLKKIGASIKPGKDDERPGELAERLWKGRDKLGLYGKAMLSMALANLGEEGRARGVLENIMQYKEENPETEVAWFRTPRRGWWYWWNSDIEANAMVLRAIVRLEPKSDVAPRLVKWLLNNRRNGYYWRSTRDTAMCVAAMSDFVAASGEGRPDYTLTLDFDGGAVVKKVRIGRDNFFTYDNRFVVEGVAVAGGRHTLKITKEGPGALYFNTYLRYFTKEEHITAAGHELKVGRSYFRLVRMPYEVEVEGAEGQKLAEKRLRYRRVPVADGDALKSGEVVQVELRVKSDNDYTYLCFEDMKPAGCEPVRVRSGGKGQEGFWSCMELRDEKVVFFVNSLGQGEHLLRYRLRAEIPGVFHALPTTVYGMYVPELRANSDERVIRIVD